MIVKLDRTYYQRDNTRSFYSSRRMNHYTVITIRLGMEGKSIQSRGTKKR